MTPAHPAAAPAAAHPAGPDGDPPAVLCFGDSNTWGTQPMAHADDVRRFPRGVRWPGVLAAALGPAWQVLEAGLPGRTLAFDDPVEGVDRNALRTLRATLESARPLAGVVLMLGTNDLKARFGASAARIAEGLHPAIDLIRACQMPGQTAGRLPPTRILIVCPPAAREAGWLAGMFSGSGAKSPQMAEHYRRVAAGRGCDFLDGNAHAQVCALDGVHLEAEGQQALGAAIARRWLAGAG